MRTGKASGARLSIALLVVGAVGIAGSGSASTPAGAASSPVDSAGTVWLCRPGLAHDPCTASLKTTVVDGDGSRRIVDYGDARHPSIDCFYLYPLVSSQTGANANLHIDAQETAIAELEASPFSRVCRVYAPMYREVTLTAVGSAEPEKIAYNSVLAAWRDYLAHDNDGRGFVLIGHSEGADELDQLIADQIDGHASVRRRLVSAIVTGGNFTVGANGSGPFPHIGACRTESQTGCVVAYNAYSGSPPPDALFGRPAPPMLNGVAQTELCTNPATLTTGTRTVVSEYRTQLATQLVAGSMLEGIFGSHPPRSSTPWIQFDDQYSARCVDSHGADALIVSPINNAPALSALPSAEWGLHVDDPNLAMGNLVDLVQAEAKTYGRRAL